MNEKDFVLTAGQNCLTWGPVSSPWFGDKSNFEFTTRSGYRAAVRRDAVDGFLYGAVSVSNPDHPIHSVTKNAMRLSPFERLVSRYLPGSTIPPILDLPVLSQGSWFMFTCGNMVRGDLTPSRWQKEGVYRDSKYVMELCETLSEIFTEMWDEHLLQVRRTSPVSGVAARGKAIHEELERQMVGGVKQPGLSDLEKIMNSINLSFPTGQYPSGVWAPFPGKSLPLSEPMQRARAPKCRFQINDWKTDTSSVSHEIKAVSEDACQITITGRNGKILAQFVIKEAK